MSQELPRDPLDLKAIDREIRINELEEQAKEMGMIASGASDDCPPEVRESFLKNMIDFENGPLSTEAQRLEEDGVKLPPPAALDDAAIHAKLWEIIDSMARRSTYLYHTDHLSDRQLYEHLWSDSLQEVTNTMPPDSGWRHHIDIIGGCSEEDIQIGLRYYDDEETRRHWATDFPDVIIPPHEDPPYDRDRLLPQPPPEYSDVEDDFDDEEVEDDE